MPKEDKPVLVPHHLLQKKSLVSRKIKIIFKA